ncbi:hypothetical protein ASE03_12540 [Kitasatospora sp. Root187]|uniref:DUF317 domain-containing protein n=1 Tax=Kitasatospora sp. Root187 TaxID=1736486 RepID=UPI000709EFAD|nr:DUF317 domain-containing protein [Kitasatospora sp. Root187]KRB60432.1 hypothetical protein ASE03_12540 [Kitasatospora sp. Root187]
MLTGAAERGTWNTTFSSRTPAVLLQAAAATLLRPAVRSLDELPTAHRQRISAEVMQPRTPQRVLVSPRQLAGTNSGPAPLPDASALWHQTRPGRMESSCGRARADSGPGQGVLVTVGPYGPEPRPVWTAEFTDTVPPEITAAWLDSLTDSLATDIDLGTSASFGPGPGMSVGDSVQPLTAAGWVTHTDDADLHLISPDGHATARITHGRLVPGTRAADALTQTTHWGASIDVTGAPGHRWRAAVSPLTPLHLVRALSAAVSDPAPVHRHTHRIPQQFLGAVRLETADVTLSPAARASRSRSPAAAVITTAPRADTPRPTGLLGPQAKRTR